jgi:hypothetical protein
VGESRAGHEGVNGVYEKLRKGITKGSMGGQVEAGGKESCFSFPGALKPMLTYGKGRTRRFPTNNQ